MKDATIPLAVRLMFDRGIIERRDLGLIYNCLLYANNTPSGLPGHNLMVIIAKLTAEIEHLSNYPFGQQNFFDAVRSDPDMSQEQKDYWLALEPKAE